jgi:hypothetical protein
MSAGPDDGIAAHILSQLDPPGDPGFFLLDR